MVCAHKRSFDDDLKEKLLSKGQKFHEEVVEVSEKFKRQIGGILKDNFQINNNLQLQERIKKGCSYFLDKISELDDIAELNVEIDSKDIKTEFKNAMELLKSDLYVKKACLVNCQMGFEIKNI